MPGESQQPPSSAADPSVLTTEALIRGLSTEREITNAQLAVIQERIRGIDIATKVLHDTVNRTPTDIQQEVAHLRDIMEEMFRSVQTQFKERDQRSERESKDNTIKVDAAFAAQKDAAAAQSEAIKEASSKSERTTSDTIAGLSGKIDDLKERVGKMESTRQGAIEGQASASAADTQMADVRRTLGELAEKVGKLV